MPDPLTHWERPGIEPASSWILVRFTSTEPQRELPDWFLTAGWLGGNLVQKPKAPQPHPTLRQEPLCCTLIAPMQTPSQNPSHCFYVCLYKGVTSRSAWSILILSEAWAPTTPKGLDWIPSKGFYKPWTNDSWMRCQHENHTPLERKKMPGMAGKLSPRKSQRKELAPHTCLSCIINE